MPKFDCTVLVSTKITMSIKTGNLPSSIRRGVEIFEEDIKHEALNSLAFMVEEAYQDMPDGTTKRLPHFNLAPAEFGSRSQYHVPYYIRATVKVQVEAANAGAAKNKAKRAVREMDIGSIVNHAPSYQTIDAKKV